MPILPVARIEKLLLPLRLAAIAVTAVAMPILTPGGPRPILWVLLGLAVAYNLAVAVWVRRGSPPPILGLSNSLVHGVLVAIGVVLTGGVHSPFTPLLTITVTTTAVRHPFRLALPLASITLAISSVASWRWASPSDLGRIIFFAAIHAVVVTIVALSLREADRQ
ncbi:MAG TPA: hypothetical protein VIL95_07640, partial [Bacillota bacterium]